MTDTDNDVELVTCPADDCTYEGVPNSVAAHYSGTRDDEHTGGYEKAHLMLGTADADRTTTNSDSTDSTADSTTSRDSRTDSPIFGDGPPSNNVELPCGHESIDMNNAPDMPARVTCETCNGSWVMKDE